MNKKKLKISQETRASLAAEKRRSSTRALLPVVPKDSPLRPGDEPGETTSSSRRPEIQVISPVYFKNHRGEVFEQARDQEAVFVIKRHSELMAIVCGYTPETLAAILGETTVEVDAEVSGDPMKQRVSVAEILEFVKQRNSGES